MFRLRVVIIEKENLPIYWFTEVWQAKLFPNPETALRRRVKPNEFRGSASHL